MKFEKLCQLVFEAKGPDAGRRNFAAQNAIGPAGIVSGPVGKSDNFELRQPVSRWDFNNSALNTQYATTPEGDEVISTTSAGKNAGVAAQSEKWKSIKNAFALLMNDPDFLPQVSGGKHSIEDTFKNKREGLKNFKFSETGKMIKFDEEGKLETLPKARDRYNEIIDNANIVINDFTKKIQYYDRYRTDYQKAELNALKRHASVDKASLKKKIHIESSRTNKVREINDFQKKLKSAQEKYDTIKNYYDNTLKVSPEKVADLKVRLAKLKADILEYETALSAPKYSRLLDLRAKVDNVATKEELLNTKLSAANMSDKTREDLLDKIDHHKAKRDSAMKDLEAAEEELKFITTRLDSSRKALEEANDKALTDFIKQVRMSGEKIAKTLAAEAGIDLNTVQTTPINWEEIPNTQIQKLQMALDLASPDLEVNPIVGYLEFVKRKYYDVPAGSNYKFYDPTTELVKPYEVGADEGANAGMFHVTDLQSRDFDKALNIGLVRNFNNLPFTRMLNAVTDGANTRMPINKTALDVDIPKFTATYEQVKKFLGEFSNSTNEELNAIYKQYWDKKENKRKIRDILLGLGLGPNSNKTFVDMLRRDWKINLSKHNNFQQLASTVESEVKPILNLIKRSGAVQPIYTPTPTAESKLNALKNYVNITYPTSTNPAVIDNYQQKWDDPNEKAKLGNMVKQLGLGERVNRAAISLLESPWSIANGLNSFQILSKFIDDEEYKLKREHSSDISFESFDNFFNTLIKEKTFNEDDFKIGVMEILGRK